MGAGDIARENIKLGHRLCGVFLKGERESIGKLAADCGRVCIVTCAKC